MLDMVGETLNTGAETMKAMNFRFVVYANEWDRVGWKSLAGFHKYYEASTFMDIAKCEYPPRAALQVWDWETEQDTRCTTGMQQESA